MRRIQITLLTAVLLLDTSGCSNGSRELTAWQEQQVAHAQAQATEHHEAARALVEADAHARREFVELERDVQVERAQVGEQRDALEVERKSIAAARLTIPQLGSLLRGTCVLILCGLTLAVACLLLRGPVIDHDSTDLEEFLILSLANESSPLAPVDLLGRVGPLDQLEADHDSESEHPQTSLEALPKAA